MVNVMIRNQQVFAAGVVLALLFKLHFILYYEYD